MSAEAMRIGAPVRWTVALASGALATAASLALVGWLNTAASPPDEGRARLQPIVVEPAPPPPPAPLPLPRDVPSSAPQSAAPPAQVPRPELTPSALSHLPRAHLPSDSVAVLPGLGGSGPALPEVGGPSLEEDTAPLVAARPRARPAPTYPADARRRGIEGAVVVRMSVDARGRVTDVVVVSAEPAGIFDDVARQTARRYRFHPARRGGEAVASTVEQRIVFKLE